MRKTAVLLCVAMAAAPSAPCSRGEGPRPDLVSHYRLSGACTVAIARLLIHAGCEPGPAAGTAAFTVAAAGLAKELMDELDDDAGGMDVRDILADLMGITAALDLLTDGKR